MTDLIYLLEWPRSGGTWVLGALSDALGFEELGKYHGEDGPGYCFRIHSYPKRGTDHKEIADHHGFAYEMLDNAQVLLMVRDPRDVIVSHYFMCCRHEERFNIETFSLEDYMEQVFLDPNPPWYAGLPDPPPVDWKRFYDEWLALYPNVVRSVVRQEDLMRDRVGQLQRVIGNLGYEVPEERIHRALVPYLGQRRSLYNRYYGKNMMGPPSVVSGSSCWQRHFYGRARDLMESYWKYAEDTLKDLGYEW